MTISSFPTPPARTDEPDTFVQRADAFIAHFPIFVTEANAVAVAMNLNSTTDTSATSNSIGTGAKTFTVTAGKSFQPGMWLIVADTASPSTNSMFVQITSYSGTTLVVNCVAFLGSGTKTDWTITQSSPASLDGLYAALAGSASQVFSVAAATANDHAVSRVFGDARYAMAPSGTRMLFQQTAAPTGWTKDATHNDKALRVVSGSVVNGGSVAFTTAFASKAVAGTVDSHTLTSGEMPSHVHGGMGGLSATSSGGTVSGLNTGSSVATTSAGGGGGHTHPFTGTAINMAVAYVDLIIATKD